MRPIICCPIRTEFGKKTGYTKSEKSYSGKDIITPCLIKAAVVLENYSRLHKD